jgi:hypothetical protein
MATSLSSNALPFQTLLENAAKSTKNSTVETLLAIAERKGEGTIASNGAFAAFTGAHTGRSPKDKFIFVDEETRVKVAWGEINQAMEPGVFDRLAERFLGYLKDKELFVEDLRAGADPTFQLRVRLISELAWQALFAKQLFLRPETHDPHNLSPLHRCRGSRLSSRLACRQSALHNGHRRQFQDGDHSYRGDALRGGDQEVHFHGAELPSSPAGRAPDALFRQSRREW